VFITGRPKRFFELARRVAESGSQKVHRHGAVLVRGCTVRNVSANKNNYKGWGNRFREKACGYATHHAELGCILGVDRRQTTNASVYVVRVGKEGDYKMSMPCPMCQSVLRHVGVKKVFYTMSKNKYGVMKL
jgi:tRNA(Arg) A34 adenosine deaminase TadA